MSNRSNVATDQKGLVSILVTMIIMIVLTLIVTGFAQLARREQREALDRQLSTQAFYAAESGINDGRRLLKTAAYAGGASKTTCTTPASDLSGTNAQYTCLLIKQDLEDLKYQNVLTNKSTVVPISTTLPLTTSYDLAINWQKKDAPQTDVRTINTSAPHELPPASTWGSNIGIMRIDLVPVSGAMTSDSLRDGTFTAFLYPNTSGSGEVTIATGPAQQGQIVDASCNGSNKRFCKVTVKGLIGDYYLRMKSIYTVSDVLLCAAASGASCDGSVKLVRAQAEIDSTGRSNDVVRRVQVRVTNTPDFVGSGLFPEYVLDSSDSICKLLSVSPGVGIEGVCP